MADRFIRDVMVWAGAPKGASDIKEKFLKGGHEAAGKTMLESLKEFPPAKGSSLSIDQVLQSMQEGAKVTQ